MKTSHAATQGFSLANFGRDQAQTGPIDLLTKKPLHATKKKGQRYIKIVFVVVLLIVFDVYWNELQARTSGG